MSNTTELAYSANDFFYASAEHNGKMPTADVCNTMDIYNTNWDVSCNTINFIDNSGGCINRALCINKENAKSISNIQNRNSGSLEKYENSKQFFNRTLLTTINLGVGVVVLGLFIYNNRTATQAIQSVQNVIKK
jgi:hypothetical protein